MGLARSERPNRGRTVIEVGTSAVRGQYDPGIIEGKKVPSYRAEPSAPMPPITLSSAP